MATRKKPAPAPPPPPPAADFDETTPPPRATTRPRTGEPIPPWVEAPLNEPVAAMFLDWAAAGRVPAGSVLCEFVGTCCGTERHSGYKVAAVADSLALGGPGALIQPSALDSYRVRVVVKEKAAPGLVVMSPKPPKGGR